MKKRRAIGRTVLPAQFKFIRIILLVVIFSFCLNIYVSVKMLEKGTIFFGADLSYLAMQVNFVAIVIILLITLTFILHRGFGALRRMENIMDKIIAGDHSLRFHLRKNDVLFPFATRLNRIVDALEAKQKK
jgi:HAMP domain-containing protein